MFAEEGREDGRGKKPSELAELVGWRLGISRRWERCRLQVVQVFLMVPRVWESMTG